MDTNNIRSEPTHGHACNNFIDGYNSNNTTTMTATLMAIVTTTMMATLWG